MRHFLSIVFFVQLAMVAVGQTGPTSVAMNSTHEYSYFDDYMITNPNWSVTGGNVTGQWQSGSTYYCRITWTTEGNQTLAFNDGGTTLGELSVSVAPCSPTAPVTGFTFASTTTQVTTTRTASPPWGVVWYWQSSPGGTSTANSLASVTATSLAQQPYSLRTFDVATGCWSSGELTVPALPANPVLTAGARCGPGTVVLNGSAASNSIRWYAAASGGTPLATGLSFTTPSISATTTYFACAHVAATGAEGFRFPVTATVHPVSVGGTLNAINEDLDDVAATLQLSGHTGSVVRWEINTGTGWAALANATTSLNFFDPPYTWAQYRAEVKNAICSSAYSTVVRIEKKSFVLGQTTPLTAPSAASYQWYRNGVLLSGATQQTYAAAETGVYRVHTGTQLNAVFFVRSALSSHIRQVNGISQTRFLKEGVTPGGSMVFQTHEVSQTIAYMDGLGRTFQTIAIGQAPGVKDVVAPVGHGRLGMLDTTYLPYVSATSDGLVRANAIRGTANTYVSSEQYQFYQSTAKVAQSQHPFARTLYRNTPDAAVLEQGAPGADWQPSAAHTTRQTATWNDGITYRVRYWKPDGTSTGDYPNNSVAVSITTDENNNRVRTYTNSLGQTVLKQVEVGVSSWLETYYIFDEFGRLKYEVPPKAVQTLGAGTDVKVANLAELIYTYTYDARGRLVEKKVPGSAPQFIIYDDYDRVLLTQDGNLRSNNQWLFMKYDRFGRVVYTGLYNNSAQTTRATVQALVDGLNYNTTPWFEAEGTAVHGYTNQAWPTTGTAANAVLSVNYYDHYNFDRTGGDDFTYDNAHFSGQPAARSTSTRGLPTGSKRNVLDANGNTTGYWITSAVFYDNYDRPIQTQTNNHLHTAFTAATLDKSTIIYDFVRALRSRTSHYQNATTVVHLEDRNEFDHAGRVLKTFRKINGGTDQQLAQYEYNALGQLVDKKLHNTGGSSFLQSVDYRYNIRGWLSSINNAQLVSDANLNDDTNDYFGLELNYNTTVSGLGNTAYYNGNISAVRYKAAHAGAATLESTNGTRSFKYTYDRSDRLTSAAFAAQDNANGWTKQLNTLNETMTYDANGNMLTLVRNQNNRGISASGGFNITSTAQTIDQLTYTYANAGTGSQNTNVMVKVEDAIGGTVGQTGFLNGVNTTTEYSYNVDGSLTADQNKGISSIVYNFLGKPQTINYSSGRKVEYTYDAAGTKLTVRTYQGTTLQTTTNYSGGFVYEGAAPALSFFSSPEGRVVRNGANFEYQYAIADHQGNTRLIFSSVTPAPVSQTATFENPGGDAMVFGRVPTTSPHWATFVAANNTPGGNKVIRLNQNYPVAATRSIRVYPGETVAAEVWCYYEGGTYSSSQGITPWITAVASAFGGVSGGGGESGSIFNGVNNAISTFGMSGNQGSNRPSAYLNYIIFDQQYKVINMGWTAVPTSANFAKQKITVNAPQIKEPGFVFVYLSYENAGTTLVNFDDVKVTHTRNNIIQYNEYYAFQHTTGNSWTREQVTGNNFLANGGTELNTTTQLYDLDFRNYDPLLGRMNGVDPMASKYSSLTPYNYSFNDPVTFTDVNGADPVTVNYSATYNQYHTGFTYDDKILYTGTAVYHDGQAWRQEVQGAYGFLGAATGRGSFSSWQTGTFAGVPLTRYGQMLADARDVRSGKMSVAEYAAAHGSAPTQEDVGRLFQAMGYNAKTDMINGDAYVTYVTPAIVSSKYGTIEMQDHFVTSFSASGANVGKNRFVVNTPYQQTQGSGPNGWNQFWSGFAGSQNSTDFSSATTVTSTALFWADGVGSSVKYSARTFRELRNVVRAEKFFKPLGVVGGIVTTSMTAYDAAQDGNISNGDWFKIGAGVLQVGLAFTPVGWGVLAYNGIDLLVGITTGTSVTDRIANGIDKIGK
ncbi:MAG: DUF6443 domain-containing protein [Cyclobacteriaceae bacterium]|jgi:RHS repeat-associated protein